MNKQVKKDTYIVCIGGANIDRKYRAKQPIMQGTSNPVVSSTSIGGVGRNIAENLGRLENDVKLLTAVGNDADRLKILQSSKKYIDMNDVLEVEGHSTGSYTAILDEEGNMEVAYANMDIFDQLTIERIKEKESLIRSATCIVIDLNGPKETVEYVYTIARRFTIPLIIIPVSSPKMDRLPTTLEGVEWLITNKDESETYFQMPIHSHNAWKEAVKKWLQKGIKQVVVTNGDNGVMVGNIAENNDLNIQCFPPIRAEQVIDVTGAGDAFCSGVIFGFIEGNTLKESIQLGMINAYKIILSPYTVRLELSKSQLLQEMEEL